jgi:hypothetical protein
MKNPYDFDSVGDYAVKDHMLFKSAYQSGAFR